MARVSELELQRKSNALLQLQIKDLQKQMGLTQGERNAAAAARDEQRAAAAKLQVSGEGGEGYGASAWAAGRAGMQAVLQGFRRIDHLHPRGLDRGTWMARSAWWVRQVHAIPCPHTPASPHTN